MTSPISKGGLPLSSIFQPYSSGAKAAATGLFENGNDLCNIYAPYVSGTKAAATGIKRNNNDLSNIFAPKVTVSPLGMNGQTYVANGGRGSKTVSLTMNTNGTWTIVASTSGSPLTGSWLIAGGTAADYTVQFVMSGFSNGPDEAGGTNSFANGASSASALTTARACSCTSSATVLGATAGNQGSVTINLYKSGVLVSSSSCGFATSAAG